jgi:nitroimidazol reductase NimA-like FMN-containing flavoprotein (pyridoxamine 5'-phosphate oxidase superfamily)
MLSSKQLRRIIAGRFFCTLATASADGKPHVVGMKYKYVDGHLYFCTGVGSKKVRNIRVNPNVAVCIPVARYPLAPPWAVQFQGTAVILSRDDPETVQLLESRKLARTPGRAITALGVLEEPDRCFLKVTPARLIHTWGVGVSLFAILRDPTRANRTLALE